MKATLALLAALAAGAPADTGPQYYIAYEYRHGEEIVERASMVANTYTNAAGTVAENPYVAQSCDGGAATMSTITLKSGVRVEHRMTGTVLHLTVVEYRVEGALEPTGAAAACVPAQPQQVMIGPFNVAADLSETSSHRLVLDANHSLTLRSQPWLP